jgi:hypothetical protein
VRNEVDQIVAETLDTLDAGTEPNIRSIAGAAVETIIRYPRSSEIILWLAQQRLERMIEDAADERGVSYCV